VTEGMDIGFSVLYKNVSDESVKTVVPFSRVNSHMVPEDGSFLCSEPGICMHFLFVICSFAAIAVSSFLWLSF